MKNLLIVLTLSLFATSAFAQTDSRGGGSDGMTVTATNTSNNAIAVGHDTDVEIGRGFDLDVTAGLAVSGSILVNPSDCDCYDSLTLINNSKNSIALGASAAGSIVIR